MLTEFNEKKDKIKEMIPSEEDFHQQEVVRRHVLHMLANEKVKLNDTVGRNQYLKLGDKEVEFNPNFRLYLHTKLSNPHFGPEIQAET